MLSVRYIPDHFHYENKSILRYCAKPAGKPLKVAYEMQFAQVILTRTLKKQLSNNQLTSERDLGR